MNKLIANILFVIIVSTGYSTFALAQMPKNNLNQAVRFAKLKAAAYENIVRNLQTDEKGLKLTENDISEFKIETSFGDLTGDRRQEAAVFVDYYLGDTGASGRRKVLVFTFVKGKPQLLGTIEGGDRANGGLRSAKIKDKRLQVESFTTNEEECAVCFGGVVMKQYEYIARKFVKVQNSYVGDVINKFNQKTGYTEWVLKPKLNPKHVKPKKLHRK